MATGAVSPRHSTPRCVTTVPLLALKPGTVGVLQNVLDPQSGPVLRSLGLTDGARLRICRVGDPCIIQVRSTRIGLSKRVAQSVFITVTDDEV